LIDLEAQLDGFLAKFLPEVAALAHSLPEAVKGTRARVIRLSVGRGALGREWPRRALEA
jgi:hypothetical protein